MRFPVTYKVGDKVTSLRGICAGRTGVIVREQRSNHVRVKFPDKHMPVSKNILNLTPAIPDYLLMDEGL